jgi:hypothetical protein
MTSPTFLYVLSYVRILHERPELVIILRRFAGKIHSFIWSKCCQCLRRRERNSRNCCKRIRTSSLSYVDKFRRLRILLPHSSHGASLQEPSAHKISKPAVALRRLSLYVLIHIRFTSDVKSPSQRLTVRAWSDTLMKCYKMRVVTW